MGLNLGRMSNMGGISGIDKLILVWLKRRRSSEMEIDNWKKGLEILLDKLSTTKDIAL